MINLPALAERCLEVTLEGFWAGNIILIGPTGIRYPDVRGQIRDESDRVGQDSRGISHGGRNAMTDYRVSVALRISSLDVVPSDDESWSFIVPTLPGGQPDRLLFLEEATDGSNTIGMKIFRLNKTRQADF